MIVHLVLAQVIDGDNDRRTACHGGGGGVAVVAVATTCLAVVVAVETASSATSAGELWAFATKACASSAASFASVAPTGLAPT
jgi:hypothetical protein